MQRLKIALLVLMLLALAGLFGIATMLAKRPNAAAPVEVKQNYLLLLTGGGVLTFTLFIAVIAVAIRLFKLQQEAYMEETGENLKKLIEETLADHAKKGDN
jgi:hypothetical protein